VYGFFLLVNWLVQIAKNGILTVKSERDDFFYTLPIGREDTSSSLFTTVRSFSEKFYNQREEEEKRKGFSETSS